jgi:hypothetical protein
MNFRKIFTLIPAAGSRLAWKIKPRNPVVVIDLCQPVRERTLRELFILFESGGFEIYLRIRGVKTFKITQELRWHPSVKLIPFAPDFRRTPGRSILLSDSGRGPMKESDKVFEVSYDYRDPASENRAIPFFMHPQLYSQYGITDADLKALRQNPRKIRLFFGGNQSEGYSGALIKEFFRKIPRSELLRFLMGRREALAFKNEEEMRAATENRSPYINGFRLADFRIDMKDWLRRLSAADFFFCPPGVDYPLCHNAVEAMAVGAIPLTHYAEWMRPPLEDNVNCLAFETLEQLSDKLDTVFSMGPERIAELRRNVLSYYEKHLRPQAVLESVLSGASRGKITVFPRHNPSAC